MRHLLIDNSNTRTKCASGENGQVREWIERINTADISAETLAEALKDQQWDATMRCSVFPKKAAIIIDTLSAKPLHQLSYNSKLGIGIDYPKPAQIGADRLVNGMAANQLFTQDGSPAIVIDFGTAVTFDVICDNNYLGGVIAPGLGAMTDYLANKTALLPKITLTEPESAIGKSTESAMDIGAVYGYRGLVREIITELKKELPANPSIICTGGDGDLIASGLPELIHHYHRSLTLEGIRIAAQLNF